VAGNPRRNALFGVVSETRGLRRLDGGVRSQIRTGLHTCNSLLTGNLQGISPILASACDFNPIFDQQNQ
jgi:hypothetical protein